MDLENSFTNTDFFDEYSSDTQNQPDESMGVLNEKWEIVTANNQLRKTYYKQTLIEFSPNTSAAEILSGITGLPISDWNFLLRQCSFTAKDQFYQFCSLPNESKSAYEITLQQSVNHDKRILIRLKNISVEATNFQKSILPNQFLSTDTKDTKDNLIEREKEKFQTIFNLSGDAFFILDNENLQILDCNQKAQELFDYKEKSDVLFLPILDLLQNNFDENQKKIIYSLIRKQGNWTNDSRCISRSGRTFWANINISFLHSGEDSVLLARIIDTDEQLSLQNELKLFKIKMNTIFDNAMDAIFIINVDEFIIDDCNQKAIEIWKLPKINILGRSFKELFAPNFNSAEWDELRYSLTEKNTWHAVYQGMKGDSSVFWADWAITIAGTYVDRFYVLRVTDIDKRKQDELLLYKQNKEIKKNLDSLRETQRIGRIGTWEFMADTSTASWSDEMYHIYGIEQNTPISLDLLEQRVEKNQMKRLDELMTQSIQTLNDYQSIFPIKLPDGTVKILHSRGKVLLDEQGQAIGVSGADMDITETYKYKEDIEITNAKFRAIFDYSPVPIIVTNLRGKIKFFNPEAINFFDIPGDELNKKMIIDLIHPTDVGIHNKMIENLSHNYSLRQKYEIRFTPHDGVILWGAISIAAPEIEKGQIKYLICMIQDITATKTKENELQHAKEIAEKANRIKSDFLAHLSHDLRNPLNGIMGSLSMLENTGLNDSQQRYSELIKISTEILTVRLGSILEYSKLDANKLILKEEPFNLRKLLSKLNCFYTGIAINRKIDFLLEDKTNMNNYYLSGDEVQISRILENIVGNAFKFTSKGKIELTVWQETIEIQGTDYTKFSIEPVIIKLNFSVKDTGIGIPPEKESLLFQPFTQLDSSSTKIFQGTGLGLTIARSLANLMGGNVIYKARKDTNGSEFIFHATFREAPSPKYSEIHKANSDIQINPSDYRILIAEDDEINAEYLFTFLKKHGFHADIAYNGKQAIRRLNTHIYDLMLTDGAMPQMDGYQTIEAIRKNEKEKNLPRLAIIGVTGYALPEDRNKFINIGADDYMAKPVDEEKLLKLIYHYLRKKEELN